MTELLRLEDVEQKLKISSSTIYAWLDSSSERFDESFPQPIRLNKASVRWLDRDLDNWIDVRKTRSQEQVQELLRSNKERYLSSTDA